MHSQSSKHKNTQMHKYTDYTYTYTHIHIYDCNFSTIIYRSWTNRQHAQTKHSGITNKHANKSQTNIHKRHLRTRKHYRWSPSISLQFSNKNKHLQ